MKKDIKAIIFDIDGTLTDSSSWQVLTEGLGGDFANVLGYYKLLQNNKIPTSDGTKGVVKEMTLRGPATRSRISEIYHSIQFKPQINQVIKKLQEKYLLCLISGSTDLYVQIVAEDLAIKDYYACSAYVFDQSDCLLDFKYNVDQTNMKVGFLHEFCAKHNISPEQCSAVGDSQNDTGLFREVGLPILIDGNANTGELQRLAKLRVNNLVELLNIF